MYANHCNHTDSLLQQLQAYIYNFILSICPSEPCDDRNDGCNCNLQSWSKGQSQPIASKKILVDIPHYLLWHLKCKFIFFLQGREEIMRRLYNYMVSEDANSPMILYGSSGCGKTSVLAKAYTMVIHSHAIFSFSF